MNIIQKLDRAFFLFVDWLVEHTIPIICSIIIFVVFVGFIEAIVGQPTKYPLTFDQVNILNAGYGTYNFNTRLIDLKTNLVERK